MKKKDNWREGLKEAFVHFPLVVPVLNTKLTYQLCLIKYAEPMSSVSLDQIEKIRMGAGMKIMREAFAVRSMNNNNNQNYQL